MVAKTFKGNSTEEIKWALAESMSDSFQANVSFCFFIH